MNLLPKTVIRIPKMPLSNVIALFKNSEDLEFLKQYFNQSIIEEAVYLASPELHQELKKMFETGVLNQELSISFLKYLLRMHVRCTPYGLFAACGVGKLSQFTYLDFENNTNWYRNTQLDYHFWGSYLETLAQKNHIKNELLLQVNETVFEFGAYYRFIQYQYLEKKRDYRIIALKKTKLLQFIQSKLQKPISYQDLLFYISSDETEVEEATKYLDYLLQIQWLSHHLKPAITSSNELIRVKESLNSFEKPPIESEELEDINQKLKDFDENFSNNIQDYEVLKLNLKQINPKINEKYLFQTDLYWENTNITIAQKSGFQLIKALKILNGIFQPSQDNYLENFKKSFQERYESEMIPLLKALDNESGIGFGNQTADVNKNDLLQHILPAHSKNSTSEQWTTTDYVLEKKLKEALENHSKIIQLQESDFKDFNQDLSQIPSTFSVITEIFTQDNQEIIALESSGGVSANKLLGRFTIGNPEILALSKEIATLEDHFFNDKITAEIIHIPEDRTGNVIKRNQLRAYEIPFLTNSTSNNVLKLNDLYILIKNYKIVLYSKKFKKEVIPILSNAHNYGGSSLSIYHFLASIQSQYFKPIYSFSWQNVTLHYNYFPRVCHQNIILKKAFWTIETLELETFEINKKDNSRWVEFTEKRKLPHYVNWVNGDNLLLLDIKNKPCQTILIDAVLKNKKIILEEFLFDLEKDKFANQVVFSISKEKSN